MTAGTDAVLDEAIAWSVRLQSGQATPEERHDWVRWRNADPDHEAAWQRVEAAQRIATGGEWPAAGAQLAAQALQLAGREPDAGRRRMLRAIGLGAAGAAAGAVLLLRLAPPRVDEDHATAVGERRRITLADGSELQLNTDSAVSVRYGWWERRIRLERGELFVRTGPDDAALLGRRPLRVETAPARFEALGTRFGVRLDAAGPRLLVREGLVRVEPRRRAGFMPAVVGAGESWQAPTGDAPDPRPDDAGFTPDAWTEGALVARRLRLDRLAAELSRYRVLPLRCDPGVAGLQVSGVFQLDGPDPVRRAVDSLVHTLPVRLQRGDDGDWLLPAARRR